MKEVKKKATKSSSNVKPKVKEANIDDNFMDVNDNDDKRLIVFIAIAILIIIATIIGLLVGCEKKEKEEPKKPQEDIVVPVKRDDKNDGVETKEIVRRVTSVYRSNSKTKKTSTASETKKHDVTFYLNGDSENVVEIENGKELGEYIPKGYSSCNYYSDEELTKEYDKTTKITEAKNIYMSCIATTYTIEYDTNASNPTTYTVEDNDTSLNDAQANNEEEEFVGWFTEDGTQITSLSKSIIDYADKNNVIKLYSSFKAKENVENENNENTENEENIENTEGNENAENVNGSDEQNTGTDQVVADSQNSNEEANNSEASSAPALRRAPVLNNEEELSEEENNEEEPQDVQNNGNNTNNENNEVTNTETNNNDLVEEQNASNNENNLESSSEKTSNNEESKDESNSENEDKSQDNNIASNNNDSSSNDDDSSNKNSESANNSNNNESEPQETNSNENSTPSQSNNQNNAQPASNNEPNVPAPTSNETKKEESAPVQSQPEVKETTQSDSSQTVEEE